MTTTGGKAECGREGFHKEGMCNNLIYRLWIKKISTLLVVMVGRGLYDSFAMLQL